MGWVCAPSARWRARCIRLAAAALVALVCVDGRGELLMPCGRCRQVLMEHGGPDMLIDHPDGAKPLGELLPDAFGAKDIDAYRQDSG